MTSASVPSANNRWKNRSYCRFPDTPRLAFTPQLLPAVAHHPFDEFNHERPLVKTPLREGCVSRCAWRKIGFTRSSFDDAIPHRILCVLLNSPRGTSGKPSLSLRIRIQSPIAKRVPAAVYRSTVQFNCDFIVREQRGIAPLASGARTIKRCTLLVI